jgi:hypothetical protein
MRPTTSPRKNIVLKPQRASASCSRDDFGHGKWITILGWQPGMSCYCNPAKKLTFLLEAGDRDGQNYDG